MSETVDDWGELEPYLDADRRLKELPSGKGKRHQRELALVYLIAQFEFERDYTERDVNDLLNAWHTFGDQSTLRRELIMARLLDRERDGSRYWRVRHE